MSALSLSVRLFFWLSCNKALSRNQQKSRLFAFLRIFVAEAFLVCFQENVFLSIHVLWISADVQADCKTAFSASLTALKPKP